MGLVKTKLPLYNIIKHTRDALYRCISRIFNFFPLEEKKVVFSNFNGKGFGDNPKYIAIALHNLSGYKLLWIVNDKCEQLPSYIIPIKRNSIASLYHMSTAQIWIDNTRKDPYYTKRRGQFYLQTWHGSIALKRIEKDVENVLGAYYVKNAKRDSKMIDVMISDSEFTDKLYRNSFWYDGPIERCGSPRIDCLFNEYKIKEIREKLNIGEEEYVVLYAPTFRNSLRMDVYDIDLEAIRGKFVEQTGKKTVILVRMHPNLTWIIKDSLFDNVVDVTNYPDVYELLLASDVLITDYSTLMFEFPIVKAKPVFCYAKDMDEYDRGFYFDLNELPFPFFRTNKELVNGIKVFNKEKYSMNLKEFYEKIGMFNDGLAGGRTAEYIDNKVCKKNADDV